MLYYKFSFLFTLKPTILILLLQDVRFFLDPSFTLLHPSQPPFPLFASLFMPLFLNCSFPLSKFFWKSFPWNPLHSSQNSLGENLLSRPSPYFCVPSRVWKLFQWKGSLFSLLSRQTADLSSQSSGLAG